jgi:heptosyltransferase-3
MRMLNILKTSFFWFKSRKSRRRVWRWIFSPLFRSVDATLLDAGQLSAKGIHRILVLRPNHRLGNILLITPLIIELERTFPGAEIDVLAAGASALEVLANFSCVRRIYTLPHYLILHLPHVVKTIVPLRYARYDLVVDPIANSHSNRLLLFWMKARRAIGIPATLPAHINSHVNWARVMPSAPQHFATLPVFLVRHALASAHEVDETHYPPLDIRLNQTERRDGQHILKALLKKQSITPGSIIIGVFADASGAKRLAESWWLRFLGVLTQYHSEYAIVEIVPIDRYSRFGDRFPTYYSSSLRKLASVISNLTCFISADGGVMHLACASGTPTIGLFSVTDSAKYEPYGPHNQSLNVAGKNPEEVAQSVICLIATVADDLEKDHSQGNPRRETNRHPVSSD